MLRPGTQALVVFRADRRVISALFGNPWLTLLKLLITQQLYSRHEREICGNIQFKYNFCINPHLYVCWNFRSIVSNQMYSVCYPPLDSLQKQPYFLRTRATQLIISSNERSGASSLQNGRNVLRVSGEQRRKRDERESRVACEGRSVRGLLVLRLHARASRWPR